MTPTGFRQAVAAILGAGCLMFVAAFLARRGRITLRYALGWVFIAGLAALGALLAPGVKPFARLFGMTPTGFLLGVATVALVSIALQLTISVSGLQGQVRTLSEAHALLRDVADTTAPAGGTARRSSVLVILPAFNEAATVSHVAREVRALGHDVIVIDDGSADATAAVAAESATAVLRLPMNLGVGGAMRCGFRYAVDHGYRAVVQCDADGQHPPAAIARLIEYQAQTGADMVIGTRFAQPGDYAEVGRLRRTAMRVLAHSASNAAHVPVTDATSGFRIITAPLLEEFARSFPAHYLGDTYEALVAAGRAGFTVAEVAVPMRERSHGTSSASPIAAVRLTLRALIVVLTRIEFRIQARPTGDRGAAPNRAAVRPARPGDADSR